MRKGFARRPTEIAAAERDDKETNAGALLTRFISVLVALLLVLQGVGLHHPRAHAAAPADEKSIVLASLGAAIGQAVPLCEHGGDPSRPDDPASGRCEHCIFCHSMAVGIAPVPVVVVGIARVATAIEVEHPRVDLAFARPRHLGSATPRGPPQVG